MIKKAYQDPTTKVVKIKSPRILVNSFNSVGGDEGLNYGGAGGDNGANSRGIWGRWDE